MFAWRCFTVLGLVDILARISSVLLIGLGGGGDGLGSAAFALAGSKTTLLSELSETLSFLGRCGNACAPSFCFALDFRISGFAFETAAASSAFLFFLGFSFHSSGVSSPSS